MDRRRCCGNCGKAGAGFCEGFSKQLVGIIKKKLPKASFMDFHSCGSFHSTPRLAFLFFAFCFEKRRRFQVAAWSQRPVSLTDFVQEQINDNRSEEKRITRFHLRARKK